MPLSRGFGRIDVDSVRIGMDVVPNRFPFLVFAILCCLLSVSYLLLLLLSNCHLLFMLLRPIEVAIAVTGRRCCLRAQGLRQVDRTRKKDRQKS